jgi:hypothetical protein
MSITASSNDRQLRLNPFAFPSSTDLTFLLFLSILFGSSLFVYNAIYYSFPDTQVFTVSMYRQCSNFPNDTISIENGEGLVENMRSFGQCITPVVNARLEWIASGVILVFALAGLLYWIYPFWQRRSSRFNVLSDGVLPEIYLYLSELCQETGLSKRPTFLVNLLSQSDYGQTIGHFNNYSLILNGNLLMDYYWNRPVFRSVVFHEVAHIKNSDIDKTYFTISAGVAFVIAALFPLFVALLITKEPGSVVLHVLWRVLLLSIFLYTTGAAVLRNRELYADARAALWDGPEGALSSKFEQSGTNPARASWKKLFELHPSHFERYQAIHEPYRVLKISSWELFCAGVAVAIAFHGIYFPLLLPIISLLSFVQSSLLGPLWFYNIFLVSQALSLLFAPLLLSVAGTGIWQKRYGEVAGYKSLDWTILMSVSLALGLLLGYKISLISVGVSTNTFLLGPSISETEQPVLKGISLFFFDLSWITILATGLIFFLYWFEDGVSIWMDVAIVRTSPRPAYYFSMIVGGLLLSFWLGTLLYVYALISGGGSDFLGAANITMGQFGGEQLPGAALPILIIFGGFGLTVMNPTTILGIILFWLYPLLAWFWDVRKTPKKVSDWVFLHPPSPLPTLEAELRSSVQPIRALMIGLAGALLFFAYTVTAGLLLRYVLPVNRTIITFFVISWLALVVLIQIGVGAITAILVKRFAVWHAMFATFVTGCCIVAGYFIVTYGFAILPPLLVGVDPSYNWFNEAFFITGIVINFVQFLMIPIAILISLGKRLIGQDRS